jgi:hypothetical protein
LPLSIKGIFVLIVKTLRWEFFWFSIQQNGEKVENGKINILQKLSRLIYHSIFPSKTFLGNGKLWIQSAMLGKIEWIFYSFSIKVEYGVANQVRG